MPFDGKITMTRLQKLERLRELLETATDGEQLYCGKCLLGRMVNDPIMRAAGFDVPVLPEFRHDPLDESVWEKIANERSDIWAVQCQAASVFLEGRVYVFGADSVRYKRQKIDAAIAAELALVE